MRQATSFLVEFGFSFQALAITNLRFTLSALKKNTFQPIPIQFYHPSVGNKTLICLIKFFRNNNPTHLIENYLYKPKHTTTILKVKYFWVGSAFDCGLVNLLQQEKLRFGIIFAMLSF